MHSNKLDETRPTSISADMQSMQGETPAEVSPPPIIPDQPAGAPRSRHLWILWALLGVLLLALIAGGSVYAGYNSAINKRTRYQSTLVAGEASNQYILAQQDIALGNYDRARQRLEYIIKIDANFPDVSEQLAFVLTQQRIGVRVSENGWRPELSVAAVLNHALKTFLDVRQTAVRDSSGTATRTSGSMELTH